LMCEGGYINGEPESKRGSPYGFKVSIYMRGIVVFSTYIGYIEYYSRNINDLH